MKRIMLLLLGYSCLSIATAQPTADREGPPYKYDQDSISPFSDTIYHRHYFINRVSEIVTLLTENDEITNSMNSALLAQNNFNNQEIQQAANEIMASKNLLPLQLLWQKCRQYRYIDTDFENKFAFLILAICRCIEEIAEHITETSSEKGLLPANLSTDNLLDRIDRYASYFIHKRSTAPPKGLFKKDKRTSTNDIAYNFYIAKRLNKAFAVLQYYDPEIDILTESSGKKSTDTLYSFSHDEIVSCMEDIQVTHNLQPMHELWKAYKRYRYTSDDLFLKEMLMNVFIVYKNLLLRSSDIESQTLEQEINNILYLYENLHAFSTDEILDAIDFATNKFIELEAKNNQNTPWYQSIFQTIVSPFGTKHHPKTPAEDLIDINEHTHLTFRRYYFVARLEKTIRLLSKMSENGGVFNACTRTVSPSNSLTLLDENRFKHKVIRQSVERIFQTKSLKPLFMVWDEFSSYKGLDDDLFVEEFSKEIFVVTKALCDDCAKVKKYNDPDTGDTAWYLNQIDTMVDTQLHAMGNDATRFASDLKITTDTDEILCRFYYINRLDHVGKLLEYAQEKNIINHKKIDNILPSPNEFSHQRIKQVLKQAYDDKNINALLFLHENLRQYRFVGDTTFSYETCLVFLKLINGLKELIIPDHKGISGAYNSVEDILNAIDDHTDTLERATGLSIYNKPSSALNKHWIFLGALGLIGFGGFCYYWQS